MSSFSTRHKFFLFFFNQFFLIVSEVERVENKRGIMRRCEVFENQSTKFNKKFNLIKNLIKLSSIFRIRKFLQFFFISFPKYRFLLVKDSKIPIVLMSITTWQNIVRIEISGFEQSSCECNSF